MPTDPKSLDRVLPAQAKEALRHLELYARRTVQGMLHGSHLSRRRGVSTDFDHHKLYSSGDSLKHMDWKASARFERLYVKRYLEDTSLAVQIVLDRSASMQQASGETSQLQPATQLAACLAYLAINHGDAAGLAMTCADHTAWLPARSNQRHLVAMLNTLVAHPAEGGDSLADALKVLLERGERRGVVVVISDLMFDPGPAQRAMARLAAQGHEVVLFQVRDATEQDFPFNRWVQFHDLENPAVRHRLDTVPLRRIYREQYRALMDDWQQWAKKNDIHLTSFRSEESVATTLSQYMAFRHELFGR